MKKIKFFALITAFLFTVGLFSACTNNSKKTDGSKLSIVTTIFPQYDFARQIAGDKAEVKMLLSPGAESHSYEPSPGDTIAIDKCDVFIHVGGHGDEWVEDILSAVDRDKIKVISLVDIVDTVMEEQKEGMESDHGDDHDHEDEDHDHDHEDEAAVTTASTASATDDHDHEEDEDHDHEDEEEPHNHKHLDEHVWTSTKNAAAIVNKIKDVLCEVDKDNAEFYTNNANDYVSKIKEVEKELETVVEKGQRKTLIFGDRFPMRYFVDQFGLDYWAAFTGCSTETDASAATIAFLIDKTKAEKIPVVFTIELSNGNIARTISEATGAKVLQFNSLHNVTKQQFESGATYVSLMKENVTVLEEALK